MTTAKKIGLLTILIVMAIACKKNEAKTSPVVIKHGDFRVIGYLLATDVANGNAGTFDLNKVTCLNIAFINPDENAVFATAPGLADLVTAAHSKNVKVLASIGGGLAPSYFHALLADGLRQTLINNLLQLVNTYKLDGIDVDLEGEYIDANYDAFVTGLSAAMRSKSKLMTAAIATGYRSSYPDDALALFDYVNVMSYDKTGPWNPNNPGPHAPYDMAVSDLDYWTNTRGIPKQKLNLGLPFYGYGFGGNAPQSIYFKDIVSQYPGAENTDQVSVNGGGTIYYNGIPTIQQKTKLALQNAGGIMIWQLMQDASGDKSLLNAANATINGK